MLFVNAKDKEYSSFNGFKCKIVNDHREDGLIEVYVPVYNILILLHENEIESDE